MTAPATATAYRFDGDGRLVAASCPVCGRVDSPPRAFHCDHPTEPASIDATGTVESSTMIRVAPERFPVPYTMAYVHLDAGPRVLARVADTAAGDDLAGLRVTLAPDDAGAGGLLARLDREAMAREAAR